MKTLYVFILSILVLSFSSPCFSQQNVRILCRPLPTDIKTTECLFQNMGNDPIEIKDFTVNRGNITVFDNISDAFQHLNDPNTGGSVLGGYIEPGKTLKFGDQCRLFIIDTAAREKIIEVEVNTNQGTYTIPISWN